MEDNGLFSAFFGVYWAMDGAGRPNVILLLIYKKINRVAFYPKNLLNI
ncbi:hypothetical protein FHW36_106200 [Chitinophaga polysaccharea]|uniref:Uncharacterized protein n=1 Tax=Chitinophaga polysaccharea TaxID=1293035 RepID=A0A561PLJ8_9BACT|nr:hypothetical protein FHW36_106200 [Chitinophaga polysaccharea]